MRLPVLSFSLGSACGDVREKKGSEASRAPPSLPIVFFMPSRKHFCCRYFSPLKVHVKHVKQIPLCDAQPSLLGTISRHLSYSGVRYSLTCSRGKWPAALWHYCDEFNTKLWPPTASKCVRDTFRCGTALDMRFKQWPGFTQHVHMKYLLSVRVWRHWHIAGILTLQPWFTFCLLTWDLLNLMVIITVYHHVCCCIQGPSVCWYSFWFRFGWVQWLF